MGSESNELGASRYRQVTVEQADALQLLGIKILYRFKSWSGDAAHNKLSDIIASVDAWRIPSKFYAVYDEVAWENTGVPSFYVEVE